MLDIKQGAIELLSDNPKTLYFLTGSEYGVKKQYIDKLSILYNNQITEYESLSKLFEFFSKKSLLPRIPQLYIVRYDKDFVSNLTQDVKKKFDNLNIVGTIIAIYDDDKSESKLDKYFPDNTLRINALTDAVRFKHLKKEYPKLPDNILQNIIQLSSDYYQSKLMCDVLLYLSESELNQLDFESLKFLFGFNRLHNEESFKIAIASRNFKRAIDEIDSYDGDLSYLFYDVLSTFVEIIKMMNKNYGDSFVMPYLKKWNSKEVKYLFNETYKQLKILRSNSTYSSYVSIVYICSLLNFKVK